MFNKLVFRNVKRATKDYLVYLITMTAITALMFSFNTMLFSKDVQEMCGQAMVMMAMIGTATFFIVLVIAWLIHYMMRFMLEKRSREFGIYLLLGMKKKEIASLYMRENIMLGSIAFIIGLFIGCFFQQILMSIFYGIMEVSYHVKLEINAASLGMTLGCYVGCYLLALIRNRLKFRKMDIAGLMSIAKENEPLKEREEGTKQWLFFISVAVFIIFDYYILNASYTPGGVMTCIVAVVVSIYLLYVGLSAFLIRYVRRKKSGIYKETNLFLLRQLASKIKTMCFTMGTLTLIFTFSLLGCSVAMMFNDFQTKQMEAKFPFDLITQKKDPDYQFEGEIEKIGKKIEDADLYQYRIYQNGTNDRNVYLYSHLEYFGNAYKNQPETIEKRIEKNEEYAYYKYDTYMKLSDYNQLRKMLGYPEVKLSENGYALQIKERILNEVGDALEKLPVRTQKGEMKFQGYYTDGFSQDGHNGADYIIVVPDSAAESMTAYYSVLAADFNGQTQKGLQKSLDGGLGSGADTKFLDDGDKEFAYGTDIIVSYAGITIVKTETVAEVRYMLTAIIFPLFYIGLVFLCVALTILSVQQLSDSEKYKFRYQVLAKLGLREREMNRTILKQLSGYYLCPIVVAIAISAVSAVFAGERFVFYTGIHTSVWWYYGMALFIFVGVYLLYFATTYVGFKRNVKE